MYLFKFRNSTAGTRTSFVSAKRFLLLAQSPFGGLLNLTGVPRAGPRPHSGNGGPGRGSLLLPAENHLRALCPKWFLPSHPFSLSLCSHPQNFSLTHTISLAQCLPHTCTHTCQRMSCRQKPIFKEESFRGEHCLWCYASNTPVLQDLTALSKLSLANVSRVGSANCSTKTLHPAFEQDHSAFPQGLGELYSSSMEHSIRRIGFTCKIFTRNR